MLDLSLPVANEADGLELEGALAILRAGKRRDILRWLGEHPEALSRAVAALRRITPASLTLEDLRAPEEAPDVLTVQQAGAQWLAWAKAGGISRRGRPFSAGTIAGYERIWKVFVAWDGIGARPITDLRTAVLGAFRRYLLAPTSAGLGLGMTQANANRYTMGIQSFTTWLRDAENGLAHDDLPIIRMRQLNEGNRVPRALIPAETKALRAALSPVEWRPVFDLLLGTGLRTEELLDLRAGEIDRGGAAIRLTEQPDRVFKTVASARTVPVPKALRAALERWRKAAGNESERACPPELRNYWGLESAWRRATASAGLRCRLHDLRHTRAVRWIVEDGENLASVRDLLGHTTLATTDGYTKAVEEYKRRTAKLPQKLPHSQKKRT